MKRKYILKNKKRFFASISVVLVLTASLLASVRVYGYGYNDTCYISHTIREGDTLWSIASEYNKQGDIRKYIYDIKELNNLNSSEIYIGAELILPR